MCDETQSLHSSGAAGGQSGTSGRAIGPGTLLAGRFFLKEMIGRGGSGTVWAAQDVQLKQRVAIKVLHPGLIGSHGLERFRREVRAARGSHPHMVTIYDLHSDGDIHFLSMELVEGRSLKEIVKEGAPLDVEEAIRIGAQVAEALASLHAKGVIHRDVKPGNILITAEGEAKLCDLGLARFVGTGMTITETMTVVGTPAYMAPEQALGKELTPAVDVYALGLTLYAMLTGAPPLEDVTALSTLMRRQKERAPSVRRRCPGAPRWLSRLLSRMLEPVPGDRPSASTVQRALERGRYGMWARRRIVVGAAASAAVALLIAIAIPIVSSAYRRGETVTFAKIQSGIRGVDAHGRTTWRFKLGGPVGRMIRADLDGDGSPELVVGSAPPADLQVRNGTTPSAWIAVLTRSGRVLTHVRAQDVIQYWKEPYPEDLMVYPQVMDLDKDGISEVVVRYNERGFYPGGILVYWPRWNIWDDVLSHRGYINQVVPIPGRGVGVRFAGINNRLCMFRVAGEIGIVPPSSPSERGERNALSSPELALSDTEAFHWHWYTPFPGSSSGRMMGAIVEAHNGPGGTFICRDQRGRQLAVDRFGNPVGGPDEGRDLRAVRRAFLFNLGHLEQTGRGLTMDVSQTQAFIASVHSQCAALFVEKPYRVILALKGGRALARVGDLDGAIRLLRTTEAAVSNEDVIYRLAQLEALAGHPGEAAQEIAPVLRSPVTPRGNFDVPTLGIRLGIVLHDPSLVGGCIAHLVRLDRRDAETARLAEAFWARAHLWWDEIKPADLQAETFNYEPAGAALACLCRWRRGRSRPGDVDRMKRLVAANPDALYEGEIALAAAELARHRPTQALAVLDPEIHVLQALATDDFFNHQLLELALGVRLKALRASGQTQMARRAAQRLLHQTAPGLLPARLAREVLAATD